jgi:hypothetical protein
MKSRFFFLFIKLLLVGMLLAGLFMLWASLQSFGTLASLLIGLHLMGNWNLLQFLSTGLLGCPSLSWER